MPFREPNSPLIIVNGNAVTDGEIVCDGEPLTIEVFRGPPLDPSSPTFCRIATEDADA